MNKKHGDIENLSNGEAIKKMQELIKHNAMCLFTTSLTKLPLETRPMNVQKVCDQGNFWFLSGDNSHHNREIESDSRVQLFFTNQNDAEFLSIYGRATISKDRKKIDELWNSLVKAWFPQGKDDPHITVIKVTPEEGFYWDTKNGKVISLVKIATAAVTGKEHDGGIEGELSVTHADTRH
jgi:general stress protein 26